MLSHDLDFGQQAHINLVYQQLASTGLLFEQCFLQLLLGPEWTRLKMSPSFHLTMLPLSFNTLDILSYYTEFSNKKKWNLIFTDGYGESFGFLMKISPEKGRPQIHFDESDISINE